MKYIIQSWTEEDDGYLFGIHRLQEMLFHYSDDIVKAPVHNTQTLLEEYIDTENSIINGNNQHYQYQLDIIAKEIQESLSTDLIIREMYKTKDIEELKSLLSKNHKVAVHYMYNKITQKKYYDKCIHYLKKIVSQASSKHEIEWGLRSWIASVVWHGYSSEFIYKFLQATFQVEVENPQKTIDTFFNRFDFKEHFYRVYFVFYDKLKAYQQLLRKRLNIVFEDDGQFEKIKKNPKSFIGYYDVRAYDNYKAMKKAYTRLKTFLRFFEVFSNDNQTVIGKNGYVIDQDTLEGIFLPVEILGYKQIKPEPRENFGDAIDIIVFGCQEKGENEYLHLIKIVDLHNTALKQGDLKDAFVNLWSVLEVVSNSEDSKSKIDRVTNCITPILQNDYFECVFLNILNDLEDNLGRQKVNTLLDAITEFKDSNLKIAGFILLDEYEGLRNSYFENELKSYPNIRNKIYKIYNCRNSKIKLWNLSEKYGQRVCWHIYRLYRLRNAIVHAGESHKRIQVLGEHLHIYVDRVLFELLVKLSRDQYLETIQDVLTDTGLLLNQKNSIFKEKGKINKQDIELLLENFF